MKAVKVCLIGAGNIGLVHLDAYKQRSDVEIAVLEADPDKQTSLKKRGITVYNDLDEALKVKHDLYDICLPTRAHHTFISHLLEHTDAYFLCEKPLALSHKEVNDIARMSGSSKRVMCAFVERFHEPCKVMKEWTLEHEGPYTMEFKRRTQKPLNAPWFNKPELGGDILLDLGIHDIDLTLWLSRSKIVSVSNHTFEDNNHESFQLTFDDGSTASIELGWNLEPDHPKGIENVMAIQSIDGSYVRYDSNTELLSGDIQKKIRPRFPEAYYDEISEAISVVRGNSLHSFPTFNEIRRGMKSVDIIKKYRKDPQPA